MNSSYTHQTTSLWTGQNQLKKTETLKENLNVDVCIVGAGIAGLASAYLLAKKGKKVVVLTDGPLASGETGRTTAHLVNIIDPRFHILEKYFGVESTKLAAESHRKAINFIEEMVHKYAIDCNFERVSAYLFAALSQPPHESIEELEKELIAARKAGLKVERCDQAPISTFDTGPCLKFEHQAQFSPLPFIDTLARLIVENGGAIFTNTHVSDVLEENGACNVKTSTGYTVEAFNVIVATNSPVNNRFFPHLKQAAYRSYAIAGKIPKNSLEHALYYDTLEAYHYVRTEKFDDTYDYIIVGGEDHRTGENAKSSQCFRRLEKWARERFPQLGAIDYEWSGQIIEPCDGLAYIGRNHKDSSVFMVTGISGNGITYGVVAGMLLSDLILGKVNPWEELYDPHRKTIKALPTLCEENANTFAQYGDWITPGSLSSIKSLEKDSGAILRKGLKKVAVYRDPEGKIHECSALCPHLAGLVRWNDTEKTWDCPCHGSRFSPTGKVINGPAIGDLEPS